MRKERQCRPYNKSATADPVLRGTLLFLAVGDAATEIKT